MDTVYDRALFEVGANGNFQKRFDFIYNVILSALWGMAFMNLFLVMVILPHNCQLPQKPINISEEAWKSKYIPKINDNTEGLKFSSCLIYVNPGQSNESKECEKYEYDKTWYESTVPAENNWVCNEEIYVPNVFVYTKTGDVIGSLLFGWLGDTYGRRLIYIISLGLLVIGRVISVIFSHSYLWFVCGCVIAGFPSWSVLQSTSLISLEISSAGRRTSMASLKLTSWSLGMCIMPLLYWWIKKWKIFFIVTTATQIPFLLFSWNIIESPRWLWLQGKSEVCLKYLKQIAKANKTKLEPETEHELLTTKPQKGNIELSFGVLTLFSTWTLARNTILQLILWISVSASYTVLLMSSCETSDGNPFLELAWQSVVEIPANVVAGWLSDCFGRRFAGASSSALSAVTWTLIALRESCANELLGIWWTGFILATTNRISTAITYYTINMFNMELYPTCIRQSGLSLGNVFSGAASALAPYIIYIGHQFGSYLPGVILTVVSLIGLVASICLPETLNTKLPETLEDAQAFGNVGKRYLPVKVK